MSTKVQFRRIPDEVVDKSWCTEIGRINGDVQVSRTLVPSDVWTNIPVRLLNTGKTDVRLKADTPVSNLEQVEILSQLDNDLEQANMVACAEETNAELEIPECVNKLVQGVGIPVTEVESQTLQSILMSYQDVFSQNENDLGETDLIMHYIDTGDAKPVRQPLRKFPPAYVETI